MLPSKAPFPPNISTPEQRRAASVRTALAHQWPRWDANLDHIQDALAAECAETGCAASLADSRSLTVVALELARATHAVWTARESLAEAKAVLDEH